jgi:hypothetical protein
MFCKNEMGFMMKRDWIEARNLKFGKAENFSG